VELSRVPLPHALGILNASPSRDSQPGALGIPGKRQSIVFERQTSMTGTVDGNDACTPLFEPETN
jgi:hypothetical protein